MRRAFVCAFCCLIAIAAVAQEAQLQIGAEVVKTPIEPSPVPPPPPSQERAARTFAGASRKSIMTALAAPQLLPEANTPERRAQCEEAKAFVEANASLPASSDLMATKLAVLDQCYVAPPSLFPLESPPVAGQTPESQTPLQTAGGVPLDLSQRAVFALTLIAVNTAKEAVINEGLGAFANQICTDPKLAPYFRTTCSILTVGEVTKNGKTTPLRTLTLKQMSNELREAMRADMDEAVPTLIGDLALHLTDDQRAVLPVVRAAIDTLRSGNDTLKGRVLARNVLLNLQCASAGEAESQRCAAMKLIATAAAISLDSGCTNAADCTSAFRDVVAADALRRLQEWGARNHVTIPLPAPGQPFEVATLNTLTDAQRKQLLASAAFRSLVLWNGSAADVQAAIPALLAHVAANKPAVPALTAYVGLLESSLAVLETNGVAPEQVRVIRATLARVDPRIYTAVDMALVTYRAAQSLRHGNNALAVVREAALETPCERDNVNDFTCGFRFAGVVLASIVHVEETLAQPIDLAKPADREVFVDATVEDLRKRLAAVENIGVEKWATERFLAYQTDYATFTETVLDPIVTLEGSMKTLRELRKGGTATQDALDRASVQVVEDAFALLKTPFTTLPVDACLREQTVSVLDDVRQGWLGVQKKEYRDIIASIVALGVDLRIQSPVIDTIVAYRPLIEAFTAAETTEEFKAAVENFIDAAPSAVELQQLRRTSSLSMYVGGVAGGANGAATFAPYVPVGLDLSFRNYGGMISLVDVGAVAALYVKDGESKIPEARLSNVFSPGLLLRYGWTGKPYTWGASVSLVRGVDGSDDREVRAGVFIAYHRPLLRITPFAKKVTPRPQPQPSPCDD